MKSIPLEIIEAAKKARDATKCPASVTIAQWALESGFGAHLAAPNNFFGIKWHPKCSYGFREVPTKECYDGKWTVINAKFISFPSVEAAFSYHGKLLMQHPYDAIPYAGDYKAFLHHIAHIYATDPKYEQKLLAIISDYALHQYDK